MIVRQFRDSPGNVTPRPLAATHRLTAGINSALPPFPSTSNGFTAPGPNHLTMMIRTASSV